MSHPTSDDSTAADPTAADPTAADPTAADPPAADSLDENDPPRLEDRGGLLGTLTRYRRILFGAGLVWFLLVMGGGLYLSAVDARYGLHVFGTGTWVEGEPAVLRAALRDVMFNRSQPLGPLTVRLIDAEGVEAPVQRVGGVAGAFVQGRVMAPGRAGTWQVQIDAAGPDGEVTARFPITVLAEIPPDVWPTPPKPRHPARPDTGPLRLDLRPLDGVLPGGLPGVLVVQAADAAGLPLSTVVGLEVQAGQSATPVPSRVVTDRHGLATIDVRPMHPLFQVELTAGAPAPVDGMAGTDGTDGIPSPAPDGTDGTDGIPSPAPDATAAPDAIPTPAASTVTRALRHVKPTATQFAIDIPPGPFAPGATLPIQIRSLHQTGTVFIDLWHADRWLTTTTATLEQGTATARIELPPHPADPTVLWVQAYQNAYLPGDARAGRHFVVTRAPTATAARAIGQRLAAQGFDPPTTTALAAAADDSPTLLRALLGRLPRPAGEPPLLADSSITARQTVAEIKTVWESRLVIVLITSAVLLFIVLGVVLWSNQRAVQRQWVLAGGDEDGAPGNRRRLWLDAGYMFVVLALFLAAMIQLLLAVRW